MHLFEYRIGIFELLRMPTETSSANTSRPPYPAASTTTTTVFHHTIVRNLSMALSATQSFEQEIQRGDKLCALDRAKTTFSFRTSLMNYERPLVFS
ncbi:uncharacterized protein BT62DRAFT_933903 [Guyanagaster necrorhizus]|uniref:Uncharacterized protein n=1 Tax=Guyanagaster necrorhizus TaxID=856835 RepID=A0A9P8AR99_9AGAR|nr:uncharacterized protein BT62DRAFT_933903 [Guyanagaster necrorhizus MCA 3950]KAG7444860.1 hypothetical protein BT62DRAFT_933903 [Guyanagaster necrorhizus MCA 3950]